MIWRATEVGHALEREAIMGTPRQEKSVAGNPAFLDESRKTLACI
jgi:hypothetical protein